jgi:glyoxylase I family protein
MPELASPDVRGVEHVVLRVSDPDVSTTFYCDVFGFHVHRRYDENTVAIRNPRGDLGITLMRRQGAAPSGASVLDHIAFLVGDHADLEDCARHLESLGLATPIEEGVTGWSITVKDPDENDVEFFAPLP